MLTCSYFYYSGLNFITVFFYSVFSDHVNTSVSCYSRLLCPPDGLNHFVFRSFSISAKQSPVESNGKIKSRFHFVIPIFDGYSELKENKLSVANKLWPIIVLVLHTSASFKPPNLNLAGVPFSIRYSLVTLPLLLQLRDLKVFSSILVISVTRFIFSGSL